MASNQAQSSIELEHFREIPCHANLTPTSQSQATQDITQAAVPGASSPNQADQTSPQPIATLLSTEALASTIKWSQIPSTINTIAACMTIISLPLTILGFQATLESLRVSWWTQSKDVFEWCINNDFDYPGCEVFRNKSLPIPSGSSLFSRSGNLYDHENLRSSPAQQLDWVHSNVNSTVFLGIYLGLLILQSAILWCDSILIIRPVRGVLKTASTEHSADYQELEEVIVLSDSTRAFSNSTSRSSGDAQYARRRNGPSSRKQKRARSPNIVPVFVRNPHPGGGVYVTTRDLAQQPPDGTFSGQNSDGFSFTIQD